MKEALFAGALLAIALGWIARSARNADGFVRHFSRGAFMRDLNKKMEERIAIIAFGYRAKKNPEYYSGFSLQAIYRQTSALRIARHEGIIAEFGDLEPLIPLI